MRRRERHYLQLLGVQPPESAGLSRSADRDPESPGDVER
jgi:hypothetical protein